MKKQPKQNIIYIVLRALAFSFGLLFIGMANAATHKGDFNGDGYGDLIVGVPFEEVNGKPAAGAVNVFFGGRDGLVAHPSQILHLDTPGNGNQAPIEGITADYDQFGYSVAVGDFDNDGYDDAAIGIRSRSYHARVYVGAVTILYGSAFGLHGPRNEIFGLDRFNNKARNFASFGSELAVGDINGDHYDDLAVGIPNYDVDIGGHNIIERAGAVAVFFGSNAGLQNSNIAPHLIIQSTQSGVGDIVGPAFVRRQSEIRDKMGGVLKFADFNRDGFADLAIGIPNKADKSGIVIVLHGASNGLTARQVEITDHQIEQYDRFGSSLAAGDFNGDSYPDLAIGASGEKLAAEPGAGAVTVLYSAPWGLWERNPRQFWHQDSPSVPGKVEGGDKFGQTLAAADFDADGYDDLAVGVPGEDYNRSLRSDIVSAGMINIFRGSSQRLKPAHYIHQDTKGIAGVRENYDWFSEALSVNDFNNDGRADLAIGVPKEDLGYITDTGIVQVLYGNTSALLAPKSTQILSQRPGQSESSDGFGSSLPGSKVFY